MTASPTVRELHRASVPPGEHVAHLRQLALAAYKERLRERRRLRVQLNATNEDVLGIEALAMAQATAALWLPIGEAPTEAAILGSAAAVRELARAQQRTDQYPDNEAARLFLVHTAFLEQPA
ncbi:hypothetical protein [Streptacidiphilus cavernicola]|uniref:Transcriptional regulator n=1 Tax=Streptacidiphilus cavernicola TaxID=3342716 RepID=A0ABV6VYW1_9ACTN